MCQRTLNTSRTTDSETDHGKCNGTRTHRKLLVEVVDGLQEQIHRLEALKSVHCETQLTEQLESEIALGNARQNVSAALDDVRRAQSRLKESWKILSPD